MDIEKILLKEHDREVIDSYFTSIKISSTLVDGISIIYQDRHSTSKDLYLIKMKFSINHQKFEVNTNIRYRDMIEASYTNGSLRAYLKDEFKVAIVSRINQILIIELARELKNI